VNRGLSDAEAEQRLARYGYNELPFSTRRGTLSIALGVAREPMFLLLLVSAVIYVTLGDVREATVLSASIFLIMAITVFQERKTERALEALRDLSSPRALVIRDGNQKRIAGREVVRDDLLIMTEGDRVPADAALLSCNDLLLDESLLTGEPGPVRKVPWDGVQPIVRPGGDDLPFVYSGTMLVQGRALARVVATGVQSELGKIGKALQHVDGDETFLQKKSGLLIRNCAAVGLSLCGLAVVLFGITRGDWLNGFLAGIALAMALLPEEIPVVLTVFLALGAWRMSKKNVLTRRMPAIEALGAATLLCVDKTGTLTLNQMSVTQLHIDDEFIAVDQAGARVLPQKYRDLVRFAVLASETEPFDPMEKAFKALGDKYLNDIENHTGWTLVHEYSLSPEMLALSHVWKLPNRDEYVIAAKGAPEAVADLCHLSQLDRRALEGDVEIMARDGLRVIGVARAHATNPAWPTDQHGFDFEFLGLLGLADPIRPSVPEAIRQCHQAGISVAMITGDYPSTARAVARRVGLEETAQVLTGPDIDRLSDAALRRRIAETTVFARVLPEQKLRLVEGYKTNGAIVAMTGDGVNDAPALKAAHVGIAMGGRGADVARESAALVLLDDDFSTIVEAIRSGRRIFDNIQKAMAFIFAIHVPIAGLALLPLIFDWPLILSPVHIVFLELIIDPACSIAFEAEAAEADIMTRPPRARETPLFGMGDIAHSLLQGCIVLATVLATFTFALARGQGSDEARAIAFVTMVLGMCGLILANRSWSRSLTASFNSPNPALWATLTAALFLLAAALYIPSLREAFRFTALSVIDLALCVGAGLINLLFNNLLTLKRRRA